MCRSFLHDLELGAVNATKSLIPIRLMVNLFAKCQDGEIGLLIPSRSTVFQSGNNMIGVIAIHRLISLYLLHYDMAAVRLSKFGYGDIN